MLEPMYPVDALACGAFEYTPPAARRRARRRSSPRTLAWAAALMLAAAGACNAAEGDGPAPSGLGADVKAYITAPIHARRPQWIGFGAAVGAIALAHRYDDDVRAHFVPEPPPQSASHDTHDGADAVPAALAFGGTWLAAKLTGDRDGLVEAHSMIEAAAFSSAAALVLKEAAGRERPFEGGDSGAWREGGDSFPSMHTTAAFAIGTVLAESGNDRYRWLRRVLGYGVGAATAYKRLDHDAHWLSDTVAGGALGLATARFVMKRRDLEEQPRRARLGVLPTDGGVQLSYTVDLR